MSSTLHTGVYSMLQAESTLTALVSTRCYPLLLPQEVTYPAVRFQQLTGERPGAMGGDVGLVDSIVMVDCYADDIDAAHTLADAVRTAMQRKNGTYNGVEIDHVALEGPIDSHEPEIEKYRASFNARIWYRES